MVQLISVTIGYTVIVTFTNSESVTSLLTIIENIYSVISSISGAIKVKSELVEEFNSMPPGRIHWKERIFLSGLKEAELFKTIKSLSFTSWSGPALAIGGEFRKKAYVSMHPEYKSKISI